MLLTIIYPEVTASQNRYYRPLGFGKLSVRPYPFNAVDKQNWVNNGGAYALASGHISYTLAAAGPRNGVVSGDNWKPQHRRLRIAVITPHKTSATERGVKSEQVEPNTQDVRDTRGFFKILVTQEHFNKLGEWKPVTRTFFAKLIGPAGKVVIMPFAKLERGFELSRVLYNWCDDAATKLFPRLKQVHNREPRLKHIRSRLAEIMDLALWGVDRTVFVAPASQLKNPDLSPVLNATV